LSGRASNVACCGIWRTSRAVRPPVAGEEPIHEHILGLVDLGGALQ
jgi:hypothetical protein